MLKTLCAFALVAILTGCANFTETAGKVVRTAVSLNKPTVSYYDSENAGWVRDAKATASLRTPRFFANTDVAKALLASCNQGRWAEVIVYAGGAAETNALRGSCVRVYVSDHPDLARGFDTLLLDGDTVVVEGNMVAVVNAKSRQEYLYRQQVKRFAQVVN
jgi:hypothetical protein